MMLRTTARSLLTAAAIILCGAAGAMTPPSANDLLAGDQTAPPIRLVQVRPPPQHTFIRNSGCPDNRPRICNLNKKGKYDHCHCPKR